MIVKTWFIIVKWWAEGQAQVDTEKTTEIDKLPKRQTSLLHSKGAGPCWLIGWSTAPCDTSTVAASRAPAKNVTVESIRKRYHISKSYRKMPSGGAQRQLGNIWYDEDLHNWVKALWTCKSFRTANWGWDLERKAVKTAMQTRREGSSRCKPSLNRCPGVSSAGSSPQSSQVKAVDLHDICTAQRVGHGNGQPHCHGATVMRYMQTLCCPSVPCKHLKWK